eukprot:m.61060 g.61060  ORF g.61060 m.61060 type:complete len:1686 (-) comp7058_c0_seq3:111-5168(-)
MSSTADSTTSMFLSRALQKILAEKDTKQKQHAKLRQACESALEQIKKDIGPQGHTNGDAVPDAPVPPPAEKDRFVNADKYFTPFRLACESRSPKIVRTALDCLQKLMAYGHLTGDMLAEVEGFPDAMRLVDLIVDTIRNCFVGEQTDEGVQLQIIKALLTAVTTQTCDIHEGTLLKAVRTCYSIYLASKNIVNQTTAKATLTQIISVIFQRLEALGPQSGCPSVVPTASELHSEVTSIHDDVASLAHDHQDVQEVAAEGQPDPVDEAEAEPEEDSGHVAQDVLEDILQKVVANGDPNGEPVAERPVDGQGPGAVVAPAAAQQACVVCHKPTDHLCPGTRQPACPGECSDAALRRTVHENPEDDGGKEEKFGHVHRKDAYLVFRSICKLALKDLSDRESLDKASHELRSKILSLDLQLLILDIGGPVFSSDPLFIELVRQFLCASLMKNGASPVVDVFERALGIFLLLLARYKVHVKSQIEVFFKEILLNVLEIPTSSFQHKWLVVQALLKVCQGKQTLMDLYVNYDCEEYLTNIFERMMNDLSKVAQGRSSSEVGGTPQQELQMRARGLECLVSAMRCFEEWCRPLEERLAEEMTPKQETDEAAGVASPTRDRDMASAPSTSMLEAPSPSYQISETEEFEARKHKKEQRERDIELFNQKQVKGIKALQDHGFLGLAEKDVAQFLHNEPRLQRAAIGDYLGEKDEFCVAVMHAYVDLVDFKSVLGSGNQNMAFLDCLRLFLGRFRIPGESQKIDRMMLKFAQRYCDVHPENGVFASPDAAYVLAYSIMMLNTDLHSTQVKRKITKDGFIRMTRGINDNRDLPKEYVEAIFDAIAKDEIQLHIGDNPSSFASQGSSFVNADVAARTTFTSATDVSHVRPMFKLVWKPLIAAFTVALNSSSEPPVIALCLEGLATSVHIACMFQMAVERDAFVNSLAHFTNLASVEEIKAKHVEAIRTLLAVALREGNYLGDQWREVLFCVSQLDHVQLLGGQAPGKTRRHEVLPESTSMNIVLAIDKIFATSRRLNGESILDFVRALCTVSQEELQKTPPRTYSLSKLVETAYYNMERVRIEWSHIWAIMGEHFNKVGCMTDNEVARMAIDNLRQLSFKFLEKGELANYSFQKDFLRPFEFIMNRNKSAFIRDFIVRCVAQMVQSKQTNIRSGWKNIFFVFALAASDSDQSIVDLAFSTTTHIFDTCFSKQNDNRVVLISSSFMDAVNCLAEFACNAYFPEISMEAIRQLRICATHVAESPELFVGPEEAPSDEPKIWVKGWFPVLFGLSRIISRCKLDVRTRALTVMFEIMKVYGSHYLSQWWVDLFRVVFRIFDTKKLQSMHSEQERAAWLSTTCTHALRSIVDVLTQYFSVLQGALIGEMLQQLEWCICDAGNEQLGRAGTECLHIMVMNNGAQFTDASWDLLCKAIARMFALTMPNELMTFGQDVPEGEEPKTAAFSNTVIMKCVTQLELIQTIEWVLLSSTRPEAADARPAKAAVPSETDQLAQREYAKTVVMARPLDKAGDLFACLTSERLLALVDCLASSHNFALSFNSNLELRNRLWKAGFMKNRTKPNLYRQEIASISVMLRLLFRMYEATDRPDVQPVVEARLLTACAAVLHQFVSDVPKEAREAWASLIVLLLRELLSLPDAKFTKHAGTHFATLCELMTLSCDAPLGDAAFLLAALFGRTRTFNL